MPTPLESMTIRVEPAVRKRLESQASALGRTLAVHLRESLTAVAMGDGPATAERDSDALLLRGLEAVAKELEALHAGERTATALVLARFDHLARALARSIEGLLRVDASDSDFSFTREQAHAFVERAFRRD